MTEKAYLHFEKARGLFQAGESKKAYMELDNAIKLDPENLEFIWERINQKYGERAFEKVIPDLDIVIRQSNDMEEIADAHLKLAISLEALGKQRELLNEIDWLITNTPPRAANYVWRSYHLVKQGLLEKALSDLNYAYQLEPDSETVILARATLHCEMQDFQSCIRDLTTLVNEDKDPKFLSMVYHRRGRAYYMLEKYDEALADFNKVRLIQGLPEEDDPSIYFESTDWHK